MNEIEKMMAWHGMDKSYTIDEELKKFM